jgi:beta-phosphoglucomutase
MTIKGLIFDLDGVLTDTAEYHYLSWKQLAEEEGIPFTRQDNEALRSVDRRESLRRLLKGRAVSETVAQDYMARKNHYFHAYMAKMTPDHREPGVTTFLEDARASGYAMAVASASRNAKPVLEKLDLTEHFTAIGDGYTVANTKPAPDLLLWAAGSMTLHFDEVIVFEDAEAGITAAHNAGMCVIGIGDAEVQQAHLVLSSLVGITIAEVIGRLPSVE